MNTGSLVFAKGVYPIIHLLLHEVYIHPVHICKISPINLRTHMLRQNDSKDDKDNGNNCNKNPNDTDTDNSNDVDDMNNDDGDLNNDDDINTAADGYDEDDDV